MREVVICTPRRTAIGRFMGGLSTVRPDDLLAQTLAAVIGLSDIFEAFLNLLDFTVGECVILRAYRRERPTP